MCHRGFRDATLKKPGSHFHLSGSQINTNGIVFSFFFYDFILVTLLLDQSWFGFA